MKSNSEKGFQKLRDLESKNNYNKFRDKYGDGELNDPLGNPDSISDANGYTESMRRGRKEMKAFNILERAVSSLSKKQRDAYKLVYKDGFTLASAGLMLGGITPQAVKKCVDSALKNIAAYCRAHEGELENA